jgi:hypothetical protein
MVSSQAFLAEWPWERLGHLKVRLIPDFPIHTLMHPSIHSFIHSVSQSFIHVCLQVSK